MWGSVRIFVSKTKSMGILPRGIEGLSEVVAGLEVPVVAISGISLDTIGEVARAGAACAAVIEGLFGGGDPRENAAALTRAFELGRTRRTP